MEAIRVWLNGNKNYEAGIKLYLQYGTDPLLKRLFQEEAQSDFKVKKLAAAMQGLLSIVKEVKKEKVIIQEKQVTRAKSEARPDAGWGSDLDEVEIALHTAWKPLFIELMELSARVGPIAKEGKTDISGPMALRILDLEEAVDGFYDRREYYKKHKKLPEEKPYGKVCIDPMLIPKVLENHKRYMREQRKKLEKDPGNLKAAELLKKHEWFVAYYNKKLKQA